MSYSSLRELLTGSFRHPWLEHLSAPWPISFHFGDHFKAGAGTAEPASYGNPPLPVSYQWHFLSAQVERRATCDIHDILLSLDGFQGLEVRLKVTVYPVSKAVSLQVIIRNHSEKMIQSIRDLRSIDTAWGKAICPKPFIRTVSGGPWGDVGYPPSGFRIEDVQLLDHLQQWSTVKANCPVDDGRASILKQPVMIVGDDLKNGFGVLFALEWAGAYTLEAAKEQDFWGHQCDGRFIVRGGIDGVNIDLMTGREIIMPAAWLVFYEGDLDAGGQAWRRFFAEQLAPRLAGAPVEPMVCYNHWIAYEIVDFNAEAVIQEAKLCAQTGIEYLVFDAGWAKGGFRGGNGDWVPDLVKIPMGLKELARQVNECGVKFGLWLEPEFAWKGAQIVKEHPEWFITVEPGQLPEARRWEADYCLMNFGLPEVRDYWVDYFKSLHFDSGVEWVRWDFNQSVGAFWQAGDAPGDGGMTQLAHIHGLYEVLERIMVECPALVLEQCAGGGTRIEPGIMRRGHLYWISDHSSSPDLCRYFQHGMNRLWPAQYANVNVVSREGILSPLGWHSHQCGSFGVSSRLNQWGPSEIAELKKQIARFKEFRSKLRGDFIAGPAPVKLRGDYSARSGEVLFTYDFDSQQSTIQY